MRRTLVTICVILAVATGSIAGLGVFAVPVGADDHRACTFPYETTDVTGTEIALEESPERIVTTQPSAAQTLWEFGAEDRVVGLTEHATYLDGAEDREIVSNEEGLLDVERVIELEPDLVLAPNATDPEQIDQLRDAGIAVYHFPLATDLDDVFASVEDIGQLTGECEAARETTAWMNEELEIVDAATEGQDRPNVLYVFFEYTAGTGTHIHDILERAGGENVAGAAGLEGYQPISDEVVVDADPEWIVLNSDDPALPDSEAINETTAAAEDQVVVIDIDWINQPAPWNVHAVVELVEHFHPESYEEALAEAQGDDSNDDEDASDDADGDDDTDDETDDGESTPPDDEEDDVIPAFGPIAALVAFCLLFVGLRRRRA